MIKIIKKGRIPGEVERIKKCHKCKTIFSYQKSDREIYGFSTDDWYYVVKCPLCGNGAVPHIWDKKKELKQEEKITYRTNQDNGYENLHTALFKNGKKEVLSESIKPGFKKIKIESDGFITKVYINNIEQKYIENLLIFQNAGEIMDIYLNTNEEVKNNEIYDN